MLTILTRDPVSRQSEATREAPEPEAAATAAQEAVPETGDYELVLGRGHIASVLFVAIVVLVVFSAISYLAGKSSSPRKASAAQPENLTASVQPPPVVEATIVPPNGTAAVGDSGEEPPVFADPSKGAIYLQMGAVERGIAVILVEGLRKRGFQSFAAPGPTDKIFRVLIGPLPDPQAFTRAKEAVDQIGLATFARKFQE
jgi:cell division septation protein DedD